MSYLPAEIISKIMLYNSSEIADEIRILVNKYKSCINICEKIGLSCNVSFHRFVLKNLYIDFLLGNIGSFIRERNPVL